MATEIRSIYQSLSEFPCSSRINPLIAPLRAQNCLYEFARVNVRFDYDDFPRVAY
jgi:hypothetical protein